jgi:hypothetical protein
LVNHPITWSSMEDRFIGEKLPSGYD